MRSKLIALSTVALLVCVGSAGGLVGACSPSAASGDASVDSPACNPDSSDTVGCSCDPSTFKASDCYTGPPGTNGKGVCQTGKRTCNPDGTFSACVGEVTPTPEICNYIDDDCDGIVDDLPAIVEAGVLASCTSPACAPDFVDAAITCWGADLGICGAGTKACMGGPKGGTPTGCNEFIHAGVPEVCNGLDDDCNGIIDDGLTMDGPCSVPDGSAWPPEASLLDTTNASVVLGACQNGNLTCVDSNCTDHACADAGDQCFPSAPVAEICNGIDDDCNGIIDDHSCMTASDIQFGYKYCCVYIPYPTDVFCDTNIQLTDPTYYKCSYAGP